MVLIGEGQPGEAEKLLREAYESSLRVLGRDHHGTAQLAYDLGTAYAAEGKKAEAIATLTGDLHGGAASATYTNLVAIGAPEKAEKFVHDEIAKGNRIMGMGHREYRVRDPRAKHLEAIAQELSSQSGSKWYPIARELENQSQRILADEHPDRKIYANVDFYTAPVLADLGIPGDEFTCLFACGRIAGWAAHILEQLHDNRLIRPQATYSGPPAGPFVPIDQRG